MTRVRLVSIASIAAILCAAVTIHADEGWVIERLAIQFTIQPDGRVVAAEALDVDFRGLSRRGIFRDIRNLFDSWLNQVELWFGRIERDLLARGIFTSVPNLARQIRRYIRHYNDVAKPIRWSYRDPTRRIIGSTSVSTGH